jgi:hypothetical protein
LILVAAGAVADGLDRGEVRDWLTRQKLWPSATLSEKAFFDSKSPSEKDVIRFSWQVEGVYVLGWALGLLPKMAPPIAQIGIGEIIDQIPALGESVTEFVSNSSLRAADEILAAADFLFDAHSYCRSAESRGIPERHGYDAEVAEERHRAINWLIGYQRADWDQVPTDT